MLQPQKLIKQFISEAGKDASFSVVMPNGEIYKGGKGQDEFRVLFKSNKVFRAIALKGVLGFGEQYMLGNFDIEGDMHKAINLAITSLNNKDLESSASNILFSFKEKLMENNKEKSLENVSAHYDLPSKFYEMFLDKNMAYTCAYFNSSKDSLEQAQDRKHEHLCRKLQLKEGETLVDLGCGFGAMAIYAAKHYKVKVHGVTLSKVQVNWANERVRKLGLDDRVKIELKDYRDVKGKFDKLIVIGMLEHVGWKHYDEFFEKTKELLKPGSIGVIHTIGNWSDKIKNISWMDKYIFPGGQLPTASVVFDKFDKYSLIPLDFENLRMHYAMTLSHWITRFESHYDEVVESHGEAFARMWKLYLYLSRSWFETGICRLYQFTFTNGVNNELPLTREHLYR
jgi:cyclopropane-fatty-acyl-phospholipid synthase